MIAFHVYAFKQDLGVHVQGRRPGICLRDGDEVNRGFDPRVWDRVTPQPIPGTMAAVGFSMRNGIKLLNVDGAMVEQSLVLSDIILGEEKARQDDLFEDVDLNEQEAPEHHTGYCIYAANKPGGFLVLTLADTDRFRSELDFDFWSYFESVEDETQLDKRLKSLRGQVQGCSASAFMQVDKDDALYYQQYGLWEDQQ